MYIDQIKISGFKSFAEDVELILEPGITTIVGPNGCGKSNVSDAIRWVLGQQSPRALRCANMQDLLFNGGSNFKPAQRAQASLHFTDIEGKLALESPEIAVRRQLTRSGESNYFINDAPCLLRDITELFMDTGIGVDAYSVMEQSKIDLILNTRPEERRFLFDEVAGITKYKHRKKAALKKLEATEQNLVRINDVIHTVQRETESLKQQAAQAERYQQLHGQLKNLELDLSRREHGRFAKDLTQAQLNLDELMLAVTEANEQIDSTEQQIEAATARRAELENLIREGQGVVNGFTSKIEQTERDIAVYKERQLNIQQQRQRALQAIESLEKQTAELEAQKKEREQEHRQVDVSLQLEESKLTARRKVLTELDTRVTEAENSVKTAQENLLETTNQVSQLETQLASINNKLEYSAANLDRITERSNALGAELESEKETYTKAQRREQQLNADLIRLETDRQKAEEEIQRYQTELRRLESEMRGMQDSLGTSASRFKSLKDLQATHEGYYTGVRAILKVRETEPERFGGICGVIAELIRTEPDYELAIEVALGSAIQNIVTETAEDAQSGIEYLKQTKAGRVTFLPLDILRTRPFNSDSLLGKAGVIGLAAELLNYDSKYEVAVQQLLGNTVVVEDLDTAIKLTRSFRHNARLVTLEGELINTSGAVTGGHNTSSTSGLLSRSRELENLQERIDQLTSQLNEKDTRSKKLAGRLVELQQTRQTLITQGQAHQIEHASLSKVLEQGQRQIGQLEEQLNDVEKEEINLHQETEKAKADQGAFQSELDGAAKTRRILQRRIERLSEQIQSEQSKREEVIESCQELEIVLAGKREKLQSLSSEILNLQKNQARIRDSIAEHQAVIDSDDQTRQELSAQINEAQRKFLQIEQEKFEAEENIRRLEEEHVGLIEQIAEAQKLVRKARREFDKQNRLRHHLEVTTTQLEMQLKAISARILEKYQISIDQIEIEDNPVDDLELMGQIDTLKTEIEGMGAVNLVAIEEYEEHKQREDFLVTQREDLEKSLESVNQAIQKINRTSRETFLEAFEQIRTNFQEVFEELFGGGETELRLTDESDVLEAGIDIIACPPGKKPQSITQLSGGERSLVAIALLFAVFKIKPSPFCVLDEVDAALDEANVLRFTNLIRKYAQETQFIIITHNKRTMEISDVMYGVTMEQAGLSKIVSAKFGNKLAA